MPMNNRNSRNFQYMLFNGTGLMKQVTLLKRNNDQAEGTVTAYTLFRVRRSRMVKQGQPIQNDETVDHRTVWHIPIQQLFNIGIQYLNAIDRIVETIGNDGLQLQYPFYWQPESDTIIETKFMDCELDIACKRVDPLIVTTGS